MFLSLFAEFFPLADFSPEVLKGTDWDENRRTAIRNRLTSFQTYPDNSNMSILFRSKYWRTVRIQTDFPLGLRRLFHSFTLDLFSRSWVCFLDFVSDCRRYANTFFNDRRPFFSKRQTWYIAVVSLKSTELLWRPISLCKSLQNRSSKFCFGPITDFSRLKAWNPKQP